MHTQNFLVLEAVRDALQHQANVFLVTVLETWGASPRPAGSLMAFVPSENKVHGSLSGGCIEQDLLENLLLGCDDTSVNTSADANHEPLETYPCLKSYGQDLSGYALPCGASLSLLVELLVAPQQGQSEGPCPSLEHISALLKGLHEGNALTRSVCIDSGLTLLEPTLPSPSPHVIWQEKNKVSHTFHAPEQLLIVGLGDVTRYLIPLAQSIGYRVSVCEPRAELVARQQVEPEWNLVTDTLPDDLVYAAYMSANCAIVTLAHDPRVDDLALIAGLQGQAHFVGALGSARTSQTRRARLTELGVSEAQLDRLDAPIGVDIGSRTPAEIAISIAAKLISERRSAASYSIGSAINTLTVCDA